MCGICGIVNFEGLNHSSDYPKLVTNMIKSFKHRGPDSDNFHHENHFIFGHARLSIIDLSDNSIQPMQDIDKNICITYNGEIYNYQEIRNDLIKKGYRFKTNSDTEVLLNGY